MSRLGQALGRACLNLSNRWRLRKHVPPYLAISVAGQVVEFTPILPRVPLIDRWVPKPPLPPTVSGLRWTLERLEHDPRVRGVLLKIDAHADAATHQSLRGMIEAFRASGKQVVAYADAFTPFQYYLACGCDRIVMPPNAEWSVLGFQNEYVFLKDALERLGIGVDVVNVSPFKSAGDTFTRNDFSEQSRAQAEWLLDARFDELVRGIARGRKLDETRVRALIDGAPYGTGQAVELGLIDAALYEDELGSYLMPDEPDEPPRRRNVVARLLRRARREAGPDTPKRELVPGYGAFRDRLVNRPIDWSDKWIGVVKVEGTIIEGPSRGSPVPVPVIGGEFAGAQTVAACLRAAASDDEIAAVVLYVDSPGGSALASDLIAREVRRLRAKKPVVAYMGSVAASGGYYVSAPANWIVAQPLTVTGSIGVISIKPNTQGAAGLLSLHRAVLKRGERAGMLSDVTPLSDDERQAVEGGVGRSYDAFKRLVAEGRGLAEDTLEPICGGRVWTGAMAHERKLVDALGDFRAAMDKAVELATLPADQRVDFVVVNPPRERSSLLSLLALAGQPGGWLADWSDLARRLMRSGIWAILPFDARDRE